MKEQESKKNPRNTSNDLPAVPVLSFQARTNQKLAIEKTQKPGPKKTKGANQ
jgi:hypothetical protein